MKFYLSTSLTVRHLACEENRTEEAKLLVSHGARLDILNKEDQTPLSLAPKGLAVVLQRLRDSNPNAS